MDRFTELLQDEEKLVKGSTLIIGIAALTLFLLTVNAGLVQLEPTWRFRQIVVDIIILASWICFWFYKRNQLPKNKTNKVGIVVALTTENDKEKTRLKTDLLRRLGDLILDDHLEDWVTLIPLNNHQSKTIIPTLRAHAKAVSLTSDGSYDPKKEKYWTKIKKKINGHLYIFGHVSEGQVGENKYFLDTNAFVLHPPLLPEVRKELSLDFVDVWSQQVNFLEKIEKVGFEFTANYWYTAAQYIIGCAAFASTDVTTALRLHESVQKRIGILKFRPTFARTQKRLNELLGAEHSILANYHTLQGEPQKAQEHLNKCLAADPKNYSGHLIKARQEFFEGNPKKALKTIEALSRDAGRDRTWMYSQAFLLMYLERFDKALAAYRKIANYSFDNEVEHIVPQIISFNESQLVREPNKIQSHFILGFIKLKKHINYPEALEHLETFIEKATESKYRLVLEEAKRCVDELHQLMGYKPVDNFSLKS